MYMPLFDNVQQTSGFKASFKLNGLNVCFNICSAFVEPNVECCRKVLNVYGKKFKLI